MASVRADLFPGCSRRRDHRRHRLTLKGSRSRVHSWLASRDEGRPADPFVPKKNNNSAKGKLRRRFEVRKQSQRTSLGIASPRSMSRNMQGTKLAEAQGAKTRSDLRARCSQTGMMMMHDVVYSRPRVSTELPARQRWAPELGEGSRSRLVCSLALYQGQCRVAACKQRAGGSKQYASVSGLSLDLAQVPLVPAWREGRSGRKRGRRADPGSASRVALVWDSHANLDTDAAARI